MFRFRNTKLFPARSARFFPVFQIWKPAAGTGLSNGDFERLMKEEEMRISDMGSARGGCHPGISDRRAALRQAVFRNGRSPPAETEVNKTTSREQQGEN